MAATTRAERFLNLAERVRGSGGILRVSGKELRNLVPRERLGRNVVGVVQRALRDAGLSHLPKTIPSDERASVLLYVEEGLLGELVAAVRREGRRSASDAIAEDKLDAIRRILDGA